MIPKLTIQAYKSFKDARFDWGPIYIHLIENNWWYSRGRWYHIIAGINYKHGHMQITWETNKR